MARRGRFDEAIEYLTRAVASDPKVDRRADGPGLRLDPTEPLAGIAGTLPGGGASRPGDVQRRLALGQNLLRLGQFDEAIEQLSAAVRLRPADAPAESHLAAACQRRGKSAEAAAHYRSVLKRQPDFVPALMGLAVVCSIAKQSDCPR